MLYRLESGAWWGDRVPSSPYSCEQNPSCQHFRPRFQTTDNLTFQWSSSCVRLWSGCRLNGKYLSTARVLMLLQESEKGTEWCSACRYGWLSARCSALGSCEVFSQWISQSLKNQSWVSSMPSVRWRAHHPWRVTCQFSKCSAYSIGRQLDGVNQLSIALRAGLGSRIGIGR
jgi:hypothetical protein